MAKKRIITNQFLKELGQPSAASRVVVINPNGEMCNSGKTLNEVSSGIPLESDNVNDANPNVNKFVTSADKEKLGFISVSANTDLDIIQTDINDVRGEDLATYFLNQITF